MIFHRQDYPNLHAKYADKSSIKTFLVLKFPTMFCTWSLKKSDYMTLLGTYYSQEIPPWYNKYYPMYFLGNFRWTQLAVRMGQVDLIIVDKISANSLWDDNIIVFLRIENDKIFSIMKTFTKHVILKIHTFPRKIQNLLWKKVVIIVVVMKAHDNQAYEKHCTGLMKF